MSQKKRKRAYIPPEHEIVNKRQRAPRKSSPSRARGNAGGSGGIRRRDGSEFTMPEPTFRRTLRRVPIYLLMIFALYYFTLPKNVTSNERLITAAYTSAVVTIAFIPLMYFLERWQYNRYLRRGGRVVSGGNRKADDAG